MVVPSKDVLIGAASATFLRAMRGAPNLDSLRHYAETFRQIGMQEADLNEAYEVARDDREQVPSLQDLERQPC